LTNHPNALCERLELLMVSKQAGNTGLRNEIVRICDELLRQKILLRFLKTYSKHCWKNYQRWITMHLWLKILEWEC